MSDNSNEQKRGRLKRIGIGSLVLAALGILMTAFLTELGQDAYEAVKSVVGADVGQQAPIPVEWQQEVEENILYYAAKLAMFPAGSFDGSEILLALEPTVAKVREVPTYEELHPANAAVLWKTVGGAYLINNKLGDVPTKFRAALPFLKRSLELHADQPELREAITLLESTLEAGSVDAKQYMRVVLEIARGDDPQNERIVASMMSELMSAELRAQRWLLQEATRNPIAAHLEAMKLMLKKERNIDAEIETTTRRLDSGLFEVRVQIGPNIFLWDVDLETKRYRSENEFTADFMRVILNAESSTLP